MVATIHIMRSTGMGIAMTADTVTDAARGAVTAARISRAPEGRRVLLAKLATMGATARTARQARGGLRATMAGTVRQARGASRVRTARMDAMAGTAHPARAVNAANGGRRAPPGGTALTDCPACKARRDRKASKGLLLMHNYAAQVRCDSFASVSDLLTNHFSMI